MTVYSLLFEADFAHIFLLFRVVLGTGLANKVFAVETLHLLVEDEEEPREASHTTVLIECLLAREDQCLVILNRHYLGYLTATNIQPQLSYCNKHTASVILLQQTHSLSYLTATNMQP